MADLGIGKMRKIGVLALQGGVEEHVNALLRASEKAKIPTQIVEVRSASDAEGLDGMIIPGGESTAISKLMARANLFESALSCRKIMGTCAGAIMLAKDVEGRADGQRFLSLMDITVSRNAYGAQLESFEAPVITSFGKITGVFIRAPRMQASDKTVQPLAYHGEDTVAAYQHKNGKHYLALTFHPELTTTKFHEFFIKL